MLFIILIVLFIMPFAFGHLVFGWITGKIFEFKKRFIWGRFAWLALLFGAIFPDGDYLIQWTLGNAVHRQFTHSLLMIVVGFIIAYFISELLIKYKNLDINPRIVGFAFALGIITHLFADMAMGEYPGVALLWPLNYRFWFFTISNASYSSLPFVERNAGSLINTIKIMLVDMFLGVVWVGYLLWKNKIKEL